MGADGTISIYDYEIVASILGGEDKIHTSPTVYIHSIFGKKVLTFYRGDNLWIEDCPVCGKHDDEHGENSTDPYNKFLEHMDQLEPAYITEWEIWT